MGAAERGSDLDLDLGWSSDEADARPAASPSPAAREPTPPPAPEPEPSAPSSAQPSPARHGRRQSVESFDATTTAVPSPSMSSRVGRTWSRGDDLELETMLKSVEVDGEADSSTVANTGGRAEGGVSVGAGSRPGKTPAFRRWLISDSKDGAVNESMHIAVPNGDGTAHERSGSAQLPARTRSESLGQSPAVTAYTPQPGSMQRSSTTHWEKPPMEGDTGSGPSHPSLRRLTHLLDHDEAEDSQGSKDSIREDIGAHQSGGGLDEGRKRLNELVVRAPSMVLASQVRLRSGRHEQEQFEEGQFLSALVVSMKKLGLDESTWTMGRRAAASSPTQCAGVIASLESVRGVLDQAGLSEAEATKMNAVASHHIGSEATEWLAAVAQGLGLPADVVSAHMPRGGKASEGAGASVSMNLDEDVHLPSVTQPDSRLGAMLDWIGARDGSEEALTDIEVVENLQAEVREAAAELQAGEAGTGPGRGVQDSGDSS